MITSMYMDEGPRAHWGQVRNCLQGLQIYYVQWSQPWVTAFAVYDEFEGQPKRVWLIGQVLNHNDIDADLFHGVGRAYTVA